MKNFKKIDDLIEDIKTYAQWSNDEFSDYSYNLIRLRGYIDMMSEEFIRNWTKELEMCKTVYYDHFYLSEEEHIQTTRIKVLKPKNES